MITLFKKDDLKSRIAAKNDQLIKQSIAPPHKINESDLRELNLLVELNSNRNLYKQPIERWVGVVFLSISIIIASLLIAKHVNKTEIEMDLRLSGIGFTAKSDQVLTEAFNVEKITISGLKQITLPAIAERSPETMPTHQIEIRSLAENSKKGVLSIGTILLPAGIKTKMKMSKRPNRCSFRFQHAPINLIISARGSIEYRLDGKKRQETYKSPKRLKITPESNDITLDIAFPDSQIPKLYPIEVNGLFFSSIEQYPPADEEKDMMIWKQWTIQDGSIYFLDLAGKRMSLRRSEQIRIDETEGKIESLAIGSKEISFSFKGDVSGLKTGSEQNPQNLMPTLLEHLKSNYFLALLWGATGGIFGFFLCIFRWFKR